ncbi:hypothetical protein GCK72_004340 [Caenorhabditis remanei]|nr:hypothetical protein GCK72_004340 [Caenorhabditis remanei]KAF1764393.1 hypothetical protein GCK72_004340 [Caenorhabditis remanei]
MDHNDWLPIYLNLENHKVHVMDHQVVGLMPVDDIMVFIRHWTSCGKELGASFSYRLNVYNKRERLDFHEEILKRIKKQFKNSISEHRYAKIPTVHETTLKVSLELSDRENFPWDIVLQILPLEQ